MYRGEIPVGRGTLKDLVSGERSFHSSILDLLWHRPKLYGETFSNLSLRIQAVETKNGNDLNSADWCLIYCGDKNPNNWYAVPVELKKISEGKLSVDAWMNAEAHLFSGASYIMREHGHTRDARGHIVEARISIPYGTIIIADSTTKCFEYYHVGYDRLKAQFNGSHRDESPKLCRRPAGH